MQVLVRDNNVDQALRVLKKKMQREGLIVDRGKKKPTDGRGPGGPGGPGQRPGMFNNSGPPRF